MEPRSDSYPYAALQHSLNIVNAVSDERLGWRGLTHGDTRVDNFFFPEGPGGRAGMLDFQAINRGGVVFDLAYTMVTSHKPALWAQETGAGPDSGGTARMLDLYFAELVESDPRHKQRVERDGSRAEFVEMLGLCVFWQVRRPAVLSRHLLISVSHLRVLGFIKFSTCD